MYPETFKPNPDDYAIGENAGECCSITAYTQYLLYGLQKDGNDVATIECHNMTDDVPVFLVKIANFNPKRGVSMDAITELADDYSIVLTQVQSDGRMVFEAQGF